MDKRWDDLHRAKALVWVALLTFAASSNISNAEPKTFSISGQTFKLKIPESWRAEESFLKTPLMVLGPHDGTHRPVVIVVPTSVASKEVPVEALSRSEPALSRARVEGLSQRGGQVIEEFPLRTIVQGGVRFYITGHRYVVGLDWESPETFEQHSVHAICGGKYFYLTSVIHAAQVSAWKNKADEIMQSLECLGV